ncbi:MAG TPA: hypothetical protein VK203_16525 [Nostocaceae cyanobacterium]|nr:hypothetical protein [Nostocaceae cyanobacterium]
MTRAYLTLNAFEIIQPVLSDEGVILPNKVEISTATIAYPLASDDAQTNARLLEGKTFSYGLGKDILPDIGGGFDTFGLSFRRKDGTSYDSNFVEGNHKFIVQFGKLNQGKIPVKLYLCASSLATQVSGSFEVEFGNEPYWGSS